MMYPKKPPNDNPHTGKQWHAQKSAFRPTAGQTSYAKRTAERKTMTAMKAKEKEMKDEKEDERQVWYTSCGASCYFWSIQLYSDAYKLSKTKEEPKRRGSGMRRWRRRCIGSEWRGWRGERNGISCWSLEGDDVACRRCWVDGFFWSTAFEEYSVHENDIYTRMRSSELYLKYVNCVQIVLCGWLI